MQDNNQTKQAATIYYDSPRPVRIGDVFYRVEHGESTYVKSTCRVCEGKKEITVNGITFKCPMCDNETKVLNISKYVVRRYRVCGIKDEVPTNDWKPSNNHFVRFTFYRKVGHGYSPWGGGGGFEMRDDNIKHCLNRKYEPEYGLRDNIFDDYKLACAYADAVNDAEMKKLENYNVAHGTDHVVTFKVENDPKSN